MNSNFFFFRFLYFFFNYFKKKGYLRLSSFNYSVKNKNSSVHITNICLQKGSEEYEKFESGNTLSFKQFQEFLDEMFPYYNVSMEKDIIPRFQDLIIDSYLSVKHLINRRNRKRDFEIFGYDFLIDEDFKIYILEV